MKDCWNQAALKEGDSGVLCSLPSAPELQDVISCKFLAKAATQPQQLQASSWRAQKWLISCASLPNKTTTGPPLPRGACAVSTQVLTVLELLSKYTNLIQLVAAAAQLLQQQCEWFVTWVCFLVEYVKGQGLCYLLNLLSYYYIKKLNIRKDESHSKIYFLLNNISSSLVINFWKCCLFWAMKRELLLIFF